MIYRNYGSSGVQVSTVGFGGMRFQNQDDVDACASLINAAYHKGINYFDTAPGYGKSEDLFGVAFKEMKKSRAVKPFYVATKTVKKERGDIRQELEQSLKRMGLDYIDFYHVWCIMTQDDYIDRKTRGALEAFEQLQAEGLIKHICVSTHMEGSNVGEMLQDYPFAGVLLGYSAMNFSFRDQGLDAAYRLNRGVVVMNPLGGGIIPQQPEIFKFVCTREDETVVEGALHFLFNDPRISVSLVGFANQNELDETIRAVETFQPISAAKIQEIRQNLTEAFNQLCTGCKYCDDCPEGIAIPKLMDAYNHYMLSGNPRNMLNRLKWHWAIKWDDAQLALCSACGSCVSACTQSLPIIERIEFLRTEAENALAEMQKA